MSINVAFHVFQGDYIDQKGIQELCLREYSINEGAGMVPNQVLRDSQLPKLNAGWSAISI